MDFIEDRPLIILHGHVSRRDSPVEGVCKLLVDFQGLPGGLVTGLNDLVCLGYAFSQCVEVRQDELHVDDLDVPGRVDGAVDVCNVRVVEAADDVDDGVHLADVAEELVAEALALACPPHKTGDVDEFHGRAGDLGGLDDRSDFLEALVGHVDDPGVGVDGAEGVVGHLGPGAGQRVEDGRFPDVGKADNAAVEAHEKCPEGLV